MQFCAITLESNFNQIIRLMNTVKTILGNVFL
jgi:hypothetical protein